MHLPCLRNHPYPSKAHLKQNSHKIREKKPFQVFSMEENQRKSLQLATTTICKLWSKTSASKAKWRRICRNPRTTSDNYPRQPWLSSHKALRMRILSKTTLQSCNSRMSLKLQIYWECHRLNTSNMNNPMTALSNQRPGIRRRKIISLLSTNTIILIRKSALKRHRSSD